jgi:hypothetical protein
MSLELAIALGVCAELVATAVVVGSTALLLRLLGWLDSGGEPGEHDGDGGGEDPPPKRPPDGRRDSEPAWWPQFERQFADHVKRARQRPREENTNDRYFRIRAPARARHAST